MSPQWVRGHVRVCLEFPLLARLEVFLKWLQKCGKGCGMCNGTHL